MQSIMQQYTDDTESLQSTFNNYKSGHRSFFKGKKLSNKRHLTLTLRMRDIMVSVIVKLPSLIKLIVQMICGEENPFGSAI